MMNRWWRPLSGLVVVLCVMATAPAMAAPGAVMGEPVVEVLAAEADRTVVEIRFPVTQVPASWLQVGDVDWGDLEVHDSELSPLDEKPPVSYGRLVAVPSRTMPQWRLVDSRWWRRPQDAAISPVSVHAPALYRGVPLAGVQVLPEAGGGVLEAVIVELRHPGAGAADKASLETPAARRSRTEALPTGVLNPELFRDLRAEAANRPAPADKASFTDPFDLSRNWVRLEVDELGVYRLTGAEMSGMGVNLDQIDPATIRVFRGGGLHLDEDPEVEDDGSRAGLTEIAVLVRDGDDGEWNADDSLVFYGHGTSVWLDRLDATAERHEHYDHPFAPHGLYWVTWEDVGTVSPFAGSPARVVSVDAAASGGTPVTTHRARYHGEQNLAEAVGDVEDQWAWSAIISSSFQRPFQLEGVVAGQSADWSMEVRGLYDNQIFLPPPYQGLGYLNTDTDNAVEREWTQTEQNSAPIMIIGTTTSLTSGNNVVNFNYTNYPDVLRYVAFDHFSLSFDATLDARQYAKDLQAVFWGDDIADPGTVTDVRFTLDGSGAHSVWDVSDPVAVVALEGTEAAGSPGTLTVNLVQDPGQDRHLVLFQESDLRSVAGGELRVPQALRSVVPAADYVVVYPPEFAAAATNLAAVRSQELPGVASPQAVAVSTDDIYASFSGGLKDWRAIRNFARWHAEQYGHRLRWLCLLGDSTVDPRDFLERGDSGGLVDLIPTDVVTYYPQTPISYTRQPYTTDESLVALDRRPDETFYDIPDLGVGRLPANSPQEAQLLVDRVIAQAEGHAGGSWRNRVLMAADDLLRPSTGPDTPAMTEHEHTVQAENLSENYLPTSVDVDKLYMLEYPMVGTYKPDARRALISALNDGTTMFYYVGHGAASTLADEHLMEISDITGLDNGDRRFTFVAFSCDVGVYADPNAQSMAEVFLTASRGGAIGAIAASWVSFISHNNLLSSAFFEALGPDQHVDPGQSVGEALTAGKAAMWGNSIYSVRNARRYNLFGCPAVQMPWPTDDVPFVTASSDSLLTGRVHQIVPDLAAAGIDPGAATTYELVVEDSPELRQYVDANSIVHDYLANPQTAFRGTGVLESLDQTIPFLAPQTLRVGDDGRFRVIVDDGSLNGRVAMAEVPVVQVASSSGGDNSGPAINVAFENNRSRVQLTTPLEATLSDTSGVNILASNPANSVLLEFDRSGIYNNVSDDVVFDPGSYTRARLSTNLPQDLSLGEHTVVMTAADMFGNVGSDTLSFTLEAEIGDGMRQATVFPNPTPGPCRMVVELSSPMTLQWDIYTVAGRRIMRVEDTFSSAGPVILNWDGRDQEGDSIANGVYLYVLRGTMPGDDHEIRETGQLVIMR